MRALVTALAGNDLVSIEVRRGNSDLVELWLGPHDVKAYRIAEINPEAARALAAILTAQADSIDAEVHRRVLLNRDAAERSGR